ncbi:MAG: hypothetical protein O7F73_13375 [Gammaproteobacteria bacterium]|nr:hypothetical protein [Gammaproteobacteria bacterium]
MLTRILFAVALLAAPMTQGNAYLREPGIDLHHFQIVGDHSFSQSRIRLTRLVLGWFQARCR